MCGCRTQLLWILNRAPNRNANTEQTQVRGKRENHFFFIEEEIMFFGARQQRGDANLREEKKPNVAKLRRVKSELATIAFRTPPHMLMCVEY